MANWMAALNAFERIYGVKNPYSSNQGISWPARVFNHGYPENAYQAKDVPEMLAFVAGYSRKIIEIPPFKMLLQSLFSTNTRADIGKIFEAHRKGKKAAREDCIESKLQLAH